MDTIFRTVAAQQFIPADGWTQIPDLRAVILGGHVYYAVYQSNSLSDNASGVAGIRGRWRANSNVLLPYTSLNALLSTDPASDVAPFANGIMNPLGSSGTPVQTIEGDNMSIPSGFPNATVYEMRGFIFVVPSNEAHYFQPEFQQNNASDTTSIEKGASLMLIDLGLHGLS